MRFIAKFKFQHNSKDMESADNNYSPGRGRAQNGLLRKGTILTRRLFRALLVLLVICGVLSAYFMHQFSVHLSDNNKGRMSKRSGDLDAEHRSMVVIARQGIFVRRSADVTAPVVGVLPFGSLVHVGSEGIVGNRIKIVFPYDGYVSMHSGDKTLMRHLVFKPMVRCSNRIDNTDLKESDLLSYPLPASSPEECCSICTKHSFRRDGHRPLCAAWSYEATSDGHCWLKGPSALRGEKRISSPGITSGYNSAFSQYNVTGTRIDPIPPAEIFESLREDNAMPLACCTHSKHFADVDPISSEDFIQGSFRTEGEAPVWTLRLRQTDNSWLSQMPIGNGIQGSFVGTNLGGGVVPLSIAGLFISNRKSEPPSSKSHTGAPHAEKVVHDNITYKEHFRAARDALLNGDISSSTRHLDAIASTESKVNPMSTFQYMVDQVMVFSRFPIRVKQSGSRRALSSSDSTLAQNINAQHKIWRTKPNVKRNVETKAKTTAGRRHRLGTPHQMRSQRQVLLDRLNNRLESVSNESTSKPMPLNPRTNQVLGFGTLDMRHGVYSEHFMGNEREEGSTNAEGEPSHLHHREYFASTRPHVLVSRYQCLAMGDTTNTSGCLNAALSLTRTPGRGGFMGSSQSTLVYGADSPKPHNTKGTQHYSTQSQRAHLTYQIFSTVKSGPDTEIVKKVHACMLVVCHMRPGHVVPQEMVDMEVFRAFEASEGKGDSVLCRGYDMMDVYTSIDLKSHGSDVNYTQGQGEYCDDNLLEAVDTGFDALLRDHSEAFAEVMTRSRISISRNPQPQFSLRQSPDLEVCAGHTLQDHLAGDFSSCTSTVLPVQTDAAIKGPINSKVLNSPLDPTTIQNAFQLGRYMLVSTMGPMVPNLQGLWADGPTSAWNGDYHFNINMQEAFWGTSVTDLGDKSSTALMSFIENLAHKGEKTAKELYGIDKGWVAHGFTDNKLSTGLRGEPYWNLCVTCGVWMALTLWEHLLFFGPNGHWGPDNRMALVLLKVFRGAAEFFTEYMVTIGNKRYTGPTTSPENSYIIEFVKANDSKIELTGPRGPRASHLAMSPAIDMSILRQLATAYNILTSWASELFPPAKYSSEDRAYDKAMVAKLRELVMAMPGEGIPVIGMHGKILEYPDPLPGIAVHAEASGSTEKSGFAVTEELDPGHRHFSSLHWLYPSSVLPLSSNGGEPLLAAARTTLDAKIAAGGGHTGWSAAWELALRARIRDNVGASNAITRLLRRYTSANGLALHPPLEPLRVTSLTTLHGHMGDRGSMTQSSQQQNMAPSKLGCKTCFTEKNNRGMGNAFSAPASLQRGLETAREDKFQLDGHGALVGAIGELLVQSHIPGHIIILPGVQALLPTYPDCGTRGSFKWLRARGGAKVSAAWSTKATMFGGVAERSATVNLIGAQVAFEGKHPWLRSAHWEQGNHPGFWDTSSIAKEPNDNTPILFTISAPGPSLHMEASACAEFLTESNFVSRRRGDNHFNLPTTLTLDMVPVYVQIHTMPCTITLCPSQGLCRHDLQAEELAAVDSNPL